MKMNTGWKKEVRSKENSNVFEIKISKPVGIVLLFLLVIGIFLTSSSLLYIYHNHHKIETAENTLEENRLLKGKLTELTAQMDSVFLKLEQMEEWEDEIRAEQNFKKVNQEIRKMGIGGIPQIDTTFTKYSSVLSAHYNVYLQRFNQLNSRLEYTYKTHLELRENVLLKESLYRNTPSIYPTFGRITEAFGYRTHPITKSRAFHYGIDIANVRGTPIYATADGIVQEVGRQKNFGKYIHIKHQFGYETKFAHLQKIYVSTGQEVKRGDIIGTLGNTGRSTGSHLHYEVIRYNKHRNPYYYLNKFKEDIVLTKQ